jgi:DNA-binding NarL/FixJ family response regulator
MRSSGTLGKNIDRASVAARRRRAVWLTKRGWTGREIARELRVSQRTVELYRSQERTGEAVTA